MTKIEDCPRCQNGDVCLTHGPHPDKRMNEPVKGQLSPRRAHRIEIVGLKDRPGIFVIELYDNAGSIFAIAMLPVTFIPNIRTLFDQIEAIGKTKQ